ncbi:MAG TPA: hypothetical protein VFD67_04295 [Gemmatimonadaceae bacterium]|nr:hypothetical protein [Gemmatimonadaceae bacterium]
MKRYALPPASGGFVDQATIAFDLGFRLLDRAGERRVLIGGELSRFAFGAINSVAEPLRSAVGVTAHAQHLEAQPTFVECLLRDTSGAVELSPYAVPESHDAVAVSTSEVNTPPR